VAGVTQDAVLPGHQYVYRFIADQTGTYWYHSHQYSEKQVERGLVGALVIVPQGDPMPGPDVVAVAHSYNGRATINAVTGSQDVGGPVDGRRIRFVNSNQTAMRIAASVPFEIAAIDGSEVNGPTQVGTNRYIEVPAAGRVDVVLDDPVAARARVGLVSGPSLVLGGGSPPPLRPDRAVDLLKYGTHEALHVRKPDRTFDFVIGQRTGYLDGKKGTWFSINGKLIPHVPMFAANKGDNIRVKFVNHTGVDHPMHLHGQHMLVLSRNGVKSSGAPWWVDTLQVHPNEKYVVQFHAVNRGIWMFHCHILAHASDGLMTHVMYMNLREPYRIGQITRRLTNHPE
jgi:FtsP/CotA-like multicopper oxidase with cupredoxin domain